MKPYIALTKPGIIMGNALTASAGFCFASRGPFDLHLFCATLAGLCLIIAAACVCNNCIDREADQKMARTRNRPLATGRLSVRNALLFAALLGIGGTALLIAYTNPLTVALALGGFAMYVFAYSFSKYKTHFATLIGSFAGAAPPVVGYCAATHTFDLGAALLFALVGFWQMPHFYAIALYRLPDYASASIPIYPLVKGVPATKRQMLFYTVAFACTAALLPLYIGPISLTLGLGWVALSLWGFKAQDDRKWARGMFLASLGIILATCLLLMV